MWRNWYTDALLVGVQNGATALEKLVCQKVKNGVTI